MPSSREVNQQIRESLGLRAKPQNRPTVPIEGHLCDFPIWSYSKRLCSVTSQHIDYDDGSFFTLKAPEGLPGPSFPGFLDSIIYYGQHDLFEKDYIEISIYLIFQTLGLDTNNGGNYEMFHRDMKRAFAIYIETDRFRDPISGKKSHVLYFRVLNTMKIAKNRSGESAFYFNDIFLASFRSGYLKRLDFDFCIYLGKNNKSLTRFLYSHILKRLGEKSVYLRNFIGFLCDVGLGHIASLPTKARNQKAKQVLFPALSGLEGKAFTDWELDDRGNIFFVL